MKPAIHFILTLTLFAMGIGAFYGVGSAVVVLHRVLELEGDLTIEVAILNVGAGWLLASSWRVSGRFTA